MLCVQEPVVSEEVELIVESLLGVLLRTILEISNRPQPAGPSMRFQFQDVTVCVFLFCFVFFYLLQRTTFLCVCGGVAFQLKLFGDFTKCARVIMDFKLSCGCGAHNSANIINVNGNN